MEQGAPGKVDRHGDAVGNGVGHPIEPHGERSGSDFVTRDDLPQLRTVAHAVLFELPFEKRQGEPGPVHRQRKLPE